MVGIFFFKTSWARGNGRPEDAQGEVWRSSIHTQDSYNNLVVKNNAIKLSLWINRPIERAAKTLSFLGRACVCGADLRCDLCWDNILMMLFPIS